MPELILPIRQRGALIKILVRIRSKDPVRPPCVWGPYSAYLDTGASDTVLDCGIIAAAGLGATQVVSLNVLGRDAESYHEVFDVEVGVTASGAEPWWIPLQVLGGPIHPRGTIAALGRDFLQHFHLSYCGPEKQFSLSW